MALKGDAKRAYQRLYMRRQRALLTTAEINRRLEALGIPQSTPNKKKAPGPVVLSLSDASTARQVDRLCYEAWRRIA